MSDPAADLSLELACKLGDLSNAREALAEGADPDCSGSTPLFLAMTGRQRDLIQLLLDHGADASPFLPTKKRGLLSRRDALVEELLASVPPVTRDEGAEAVEAVDGAKAADKAAAA